MNLLDRKVSPAWQSRGIPMPLVLACLILFAGSITARAQDTGGKDLEIQVSDLFSQTCARTGCHAGPVPQMGMDLSPDQFYASTVGVASQERPELKRIDPGQPDVSYLLMKVRGAEGIIGARMPLVGDTLTAEEIQTLEEWVDSLTEADTMKRIEPKGMGAVFPFNGWRVINLPTTRTVDSGSWLFEIRHRFNPPIDQGYEAFYGLDGSGIIHLGMGYAFTDRLLVSLARSNATDNVELQGRYVFLRQGGARGAPFALGMLGTANWITEKSEDESVFRDEAFKLSAQLALTRQVGDRLGLALVPGILFNSAENVSDEPPNITVGLAGQVHVWRSIALIGEWVPIISGYTRTTTFGNDNRFDSWGSGVQITTGGHVFQIVVSNSVGLATDQYLRGGDLDITEGDLRLGFNIFRVLNF